VDLQNDLQNIENVEIKLMSKKQFKVKITKKEARRILGKDADFFEIAGKSVFCGACFPKTNQSVVIVNYDIFVDNFGCIILEGFCKNCSRPVSRYIESGKNPAAFKRAMEIVKNKRKDLVIPKNCKLEKYELKGELVDKFDDEDLFDGCPVCQATKLAQKKGRMLTPAKLYETMKKAKEKRGMVGGEWFKKTKKKTKEFKMPKWMECTWRRVPCGRDDCPICGRIKKDRQRHIEKGEDPDDIRSVFEDVGRNFKEVLQMIKKDAESRGFDITNIENIKEPPEPEEFPLYGEIEKWNKSVMVLRDTAQVLGEFWIHTEAAADLFWYANTLIAKTYRQLCNKWHIENDDEYGDFDYQYTGYVLKECLKILKKSLEELSKNNSFQKKELDLILSQLLKLEKQIIKI